MIGYSSYILSLFFAFSIHYHPVHVSILNIDYVNGQPAIDLSFKLFTADLEFAIAHNYNVALNLGQPNENPENVKHINKYVSNLFTMRINNNDPSKLVYKNKKINEDATWLYFAIPFKGEVKELVIHNLLLFDIYEDQTNLVIIAINGKETGYRFDYNKREIKIKI
jgi:hypothetical protein